MNQIKRKIHLEYSVSFLYLLILISYFLPSSSLAQISFEKTYGGTDNDQGHSVQQTSDGGYIVAGHRELFGAGIYLVKTDSLGDTLWTKAYGRSVNDVARGIQLTSDGGYIIVGSTGVTFLNIYLAKADSLGDSIWTRNYGGPSLDAGHSVYETSDGGYIMTGWTSSFGAGSGDVYLVKTDSSGDTLWTRTYGGTSADVGLSVQQTPDGGYIISGYTESSGAGSDDIYLIKTDSIGDTLWTRTYGGIWDEWGKSVQQTSDGGYIVAGNSVSFGMGNGDVYVVKTNSMGDTLWARTYGRAGIDHGESIQQTSDGGYIIAGGTEWLGNTDVFLIKTDSIGDTIWTSTFGDTSVDVGRSVQQTTDGGYIIAGLTSSFGAGGEDVYLIKTAGDGTVGIDEEFTKSKVNYTKITLLQNLPNPFQRWTVIGYSLPESRTVTLKIYDINGRLVETLVNDQKEPGFYEVQWDGNNHANGIYFYRLTNSNLTATKKMILLK
jgi:hypothetical protein